jgi:hypothetical protein
MEPVSPEHREVDKAQQMAQALADVKPGDMAGAFEAVAHKINKSTDSDVDEEGEAQKIFLAEVKEEREKPKGERNYQKFIQQLEARNMPPQDIHELMNVIFTDDPGGYKDFLPPIATSEESEKNPSEESDSDDIMPAPIKQIQSEVADLQTQADQLNQEIKERGDLGPTAEQQLRADKIIPNVFGLLAKMGENKGVRIGSKILFWLIISQLLVILWSFSKAPGGRG